MNDIRFHPIGRIESDGGGLRIKLDPPYGKGLRGLAGYGHVQVLWWADGCDTETARATLVETKPYVKGPDEIGVFALRSPERPNPIALSVAPVAYVDETAGTVGLHYIDTFPGTAVLDLKPYTPSLDRVEHPTTPEWCRHWPRSCEESGNFDWTTEFNF